MELMLCTYISVATVARSTHLIEQMKSENYGRVVASATPCAKVCCAIIFNNNL